MLNKILFAGPVGAGKTTAIAAVSDTPVVKTDAMATDEVRDRKNRTTVAMDYGTLKVDSELTIQLIGTPGQQRFDFMWEILAMGAIGAVLLIDNARPDPLDDLDFYLKCFDRVLTKKGAKGVVGVTRRDLQATPTMAEYRERIKALGSRWPAFELDARVRVDVKVALMALVAELNPHANRRRVA